MNPSRLLIVDDEVALLALLRRSLERRGFQVDIAANPKEALALFHADPDYYSMVVTDLAMEGMNGEELIAELRRIRPALPALIASGYPHQTHLVDVGFVQKPVLPNVLAEAVERALNGGSKVS